MRSSRTSPTLSVRASPKHSASQRRRCASGSSRFVSRREAPCRHLPLASTGQGLCALGHDAVHAAAVGLHSAGDEVVLAAAAAEDRVVLSADTDFGTILARVRARREPCRYFARSPTSSGAVTVVAGSSPRRMTRKRRRRRIFRRSRMTADGRSAIPATSSASGRDPPSSLLHHDRTFDDRTAQA